MPAYPGNGLATPLSYNKQLYMWMNDSVPVNTSPGSLSVAYQVQRIDGAYYPWGLSFEVWFSGNPGTFEVDIMGANTDNGYPTPGNYVQLGSITSVNGSYVGRWYMPSNIWPKYVAAYMKSLTNTAVTVSLQVTR